MIWEDAVLGTTTRWPSFGKGRHPAVTMARYRLHAPSPVRGLPAAALVSLMVACSGPATDQSATSRPTTACSSESAAQPAPPSFPLRVAPGGRHLLDAKEKPFLITGDTAWSIIAQLPDAAVTEYLDDRKARGFNTVLMNLIEFSYASRAPANIYGEQPFTTPGDFSTPNEAYFGRADSVIEKAADRGLLVLLDPAYFGYANDGWYDLMVANGATKIEQYGRYVGQRYSRCANILWVIGGDRTPPDTALGDSLVRGIQATDPDSLFTAHADSEASVNEIWGKSPWLALSTVFTYHDVWPRAVAIYKQAAKPFILIESAYENDGWNVQTPTRIRTQAYHALLAGAAGQVFGNNPIWHFDGPGCCSADQFPSTWRDALRLEGSRSMTVLASVFGRYAWYGLEPDVDSTFATAGISDGQDRAAAAVARDGAFGIVFIPSARTITLDLHRLRGPANLLWIDPTNGVERRGPTGASGTLRIATPGANATSGQDWLLIAQTQDPPGSQNRR
jgi:hypothetical protein